MGEAAPTGGPHNAVPRARHAVWWKLAVGVVFAVLGTLLLVKVVGVGVGQRTVTALSPTPAAVLDEVTGIPLATYDEVGVRSPTVPVVAPVPLHDASALFVRDTAGRKLPLVLFVGAEYNAFSAAERWPLVAALSRFGRFTSLYDVESSSIDYAPNTPTFSFYDVDYHSDFLVLRAYEVAADVRRRGRYLPLMHVPARFTAVERHLDPTAVYPFVDVGNVAKVREAGLSPVTFVGLSRNQIAGALADPRNPVSRSIVASANYLTAAICLADGERPGAVCDSAGVRAADAAMGVATAR